MRFISSLIPILNRFLIWICFQPNPSYQKNRTIATARPRRCKICPSIWASILDPRLVLICLSAPKPRKNRLQSITSTKINIESVQTSFPLFDFTTRKEVVVKDRYSLDDADGNRKKRTNYYLFDHGSLGNVWSYKWDTSALKYYLNFM